MPHIRKTKDEYVLLADYGQGWEEDVTETSYREIIERLKEYRKNMPEYEFTYRKRRIKIEKSK